MDMDIVHGTFSMKRTKNRTEPQHTVALNNYTPTVQEHRHALTETILCKIYEKNYKFTRSIAWRCSYCNLSSQRIVRQFVCSALVFSFPIQHEMHAIMSKKKGIGRCRHVFEFDLIWNENIVY